MALTSCSLKIHGDNDQGAQHRHAWAFGRSIVSLTGVCLILLLLVSVMVDLQERRILRGVSMVAVQEKQVSVPRTDSLSKENSVSACIMVLDDNHYLIEWLAYHYHVLPLRRIIVHPDPDSLTSPLPILERWKNRIEYSIYNDTDIWPDGLPSKMTDNGSAKDHFLKRQRAFVYQCLSQLQEEGRHWVILTDSDEYTMINPQARNTTHPMYHFNSTGLAIPSQMESGSVLSLLQSAVNRTSVTNQQPNTYSLEDPCIGITRKNFGAREFEEETLLTPSSQKKESFLRHFAKKLMSLQISSARKTDNSSLTNNELPLFNNSHFATHRWRHYTHKRTPGKMMVDLSRIPAQNITEDVSIHRPIKAACSQKKMMTHQNPLIAYHYSGTLEQVLFRSGRDKWTNNNTERWVEEREHHYGQVAPTVIHDWLDGFVDNVGKVEAKHLLENVGKPKEAAKGGYNRKRNNTGIPI